ALGLRRIEPKLSKRERVSRAVRRRRPLASIAKSKRGDDHARVIDERDPLAVVVETSGRVPDRVLDAVAPDDGVPIDTDDDVTARSEDRPRRKLELDPLDEGPARQVDGRGRLVRELDELEPVLAFRRVVVDLGDHDRIRTAAEDACDEKREAETRERPRTD